MSGLPEGPVPEPDLESAIWWDGLRAHKILLQQCDECGRPRFPPMPSCPWCAAVACHVVESPGHGTVYSFVTAHVAISPGYETDLPYTVATVELAEGPRILGRMEPPTPVALGDRVAPRFLAHPTWTELYFAPTAALTADPVAAQTAPPVAAQTAPPDAAQTVAPADAAVGRA